MSKSARESRLNPDRIGGLHVCRETAATLVSFVQRGSRQFVVAYCRPVIGPVTLAAWVNGLDERDPVALIPTLEPPAYPALIKNITDLHNAQEDPHSVLENLKHGWARMIAEAL